MATLQPVHIPDIGSPDPVTVIEILVAEGDTIAEDDSLLTLESEKATMEVPSPAAGVVKSLKVAVDDKVKEGDVILMLEVAGDETSPSAAAPVVEEAVATKQSIEELVPTIEKPIFTAQPTASVEPVTFSGESHAGPAVRRMAREFGVDLGQVTGHGRKGRVMKSDVKGYVRDTLQNGATGTGLPSLPEVDFSAFGDVETQPLSRIKQLSGSNLHRNWVNIPHVTQFDEADITSMEAFRQSAKNVAEKQGCKLTPLVFIMKAVVSCLQEFPLFNASLSANGEALIVKKYFHLGVAVDTPNGLVVPVIRDVDKKGLFDLAQELAAISTKAREKGLTPKEMQGGCFTISSLGGISGTAFTPIVNYPDVAILGVSRSSTKPIYNKETDSFVPRLMLPLSLSYDHRVIDGAEAARFTKHLSYILGDIRRLLL
ncbi:MAG: dihydrolipoyllysine-residue acetyltransferase [Gammaproteobacteria bacterium]